MTELPKDTTVFRPNPAVIGQEVEGRLVLVHTGTNDIVELNATAARFWQLLEEHGDLAEVRRRLLEEFDVAQAQLDAEIETVLDILISRDLVVPRASLPT